MFGMDNHSLHNRSAIVQLILIICACSLAVHFIAEGMESGNGHLFLEASSGAAGHTLTFHEQSDDLFIYSFRVISSPVYLFLHTRLPKISRSQSLSISPQLPPPN